MSVTVAKSKPFKEQLDFFKAKLNLPTDRWDDIMHGAHDRAFVVAGAAQADLLNDLRQAVQKAIEQGTGLDEFRKDFRKLVQRHGWTGWTGEGSEAGEAWRMRIIYQTNIATSYAAGRWKQLTNAKLLMVAPYWKYVHSDTVEHPRELHKSWNGLVLPYDHPFWQTHFPPNGWGCQCRVFAVDQREYEKAKAEGRAEAPPGWDQIDPKTGAPLGIDRGFAYAPGANADKPLQQLIDDKLVKLDAPIGSQLYEVMQTPLQAERNAAHQDFVNSVFADPVVRGRTTIAGAISPDVLAWLAANKNIVPASAEIVLKDGLLLEQAGVRSEFVGETLAIQDWTGLLEGLASPAQVLFDTNSGMLLYILGTAGNSQQKLAIELDYKVAKRAGALNKIISAFKLSDEKIAAAIYDGLLQVVK
ncbi:phage minor head protein [Pseudoduganella sp. RAF19]|uniref:phage minor head protein n=1 Tax=Pseudoduganella sp. RAF19 TaxID=3233052 RepID=UPI003F98BC6F